MMDETLLRINTQIAKTCGAVKSDFRQEYHMMPPVGWMNDPNGLVKFGGKYNLYYQFNPCDTCPGTMLWGHFTSQDLIEYSDRGVAIVPQSQHVSIFSGGAIEYCGKLAAVFTEHYEYEGVRREEIYMALSEDGMFFTERKKIFDNDSLPAEISRCDFRDPFPVKSEDGYYVFVGGKLTEENRGIIVVLGGKDLEKLEYKFSIGPFYELGDMGECPCYRRMDGKDVIICSACNVPERGNDFSNVNSSVFIVGSIDFVRGEMHVDSISEIDKGDAFYAPQLINGEDKPIMIAWHEMWGKPYPTSDLKHGWVGCFTIPRELSVSDGVVYQKPVETLEKYLSPYHGKGVPRCADMRFAFDGNGILRLSGKNGSVLVGSKDGKVYLDTTLSNNLNGCIRSTDGCYDKPTVRILLDVSGIEIFVDGGREVISSRMYIEGDLEVTDKQSVCGFEVKQVLV